MRTSAKVFMMLLVLVITGHANAQSPREQLQQMVEQLRGNPTDNALRERIIKLAQEIKPAPAIPEEAQRRLARGTAAFKDAKTTTDYQDAAREFEQATLAAPWYGDAYYNLGMAQDKAEQYEAALRSLRLAQLVAPESQEIKDLIYQVEYRHEKANSPAVREARSKAEEQRFLASLDGAIFDCGWFGGRGYESRRHNWYEFKGGQLQYWAQFPDFGTPPERGGPPKLITGKTTRFAETRTADGEIYAAHTFILDQDKLTFIYGSTRPTVCPKQ